MVADFKFEEKIGSNYRTFGKYVFEINTFLFHVILQNTCTYG